MNVWAITGGIACGKSTVSEFFRELGAEIHDADADARAARADLQVQARIREAFGTVEPAALARAIYADPAARKTLNGIIHPEVRKRIRLAIDTARTSAKPGLLLYEVPLLFEGGLETWFDGAICAYAPVEVQRERLRLRHPELTETQISERLASQLPIDDKARLANYVVRTDVSLDETRQQVASLWSQLST